VSRYVQTATRGQNREGEDQECGYLLDLNRGDQKHQKSLWTIGLGFTHVGTWNGGFFTSPIFSLSSEAFLPGFSSHSAGEWPVCPQTKHFSCCPVVVTTSLNMEKWGSCVARASMIKSASCKGPHFPQTSEKSEAPNLQKMLQLLAISSCFRCTIKNLTQGTTMLLQNVTNI
jgi:hypothetical protein